MTDGFGPRDEGRVDVQGPEYVRHLGVRLVNPYLRGPDPLILVKDYRSNTRWCDPVGVKQNPETRVYN